MSRSTEQQGKPSILIVDDIPENIDILKEVLRKDYTLYPALNGKTALRIARAHPPPDLILLDIMMPEISGFTVLAELQQDPGTHHIPVIFITALAYEVNELRGLQAGAVDYITKPFNPLVVQTRVATHLALRRAHNQLAQHNQKLHDERLAVEDIITRMRAHQQFDDRYLRYLIEPAERANGDILLATFTPEGRQWVLVGDFVGHGLRAAVAAPLVSHIFYSHAAAGGSMTDALAAINTVLCQQLPVDFFMATSVADIAANRRDVCLWSGGMPECLLMEAPSHHCTHLATPSLLPLGILETIDIPAAGLALSLTPGSRLYLCTDGITEASRTTDELFGLSRLQQFLAQLETNAPLDGLLHELQVFQGSELFHDDITLVEITL